MMIFGIVFSILTIALIGVAIKYKLQTKKEFTQKQSEAIAALLESKEYVPKKVYYVSDEMFIAINQNQDKIGIIHNLNPETGEANFYTISAKLITEITKTSVGINIVFISNGSKDVFSIPTNNKQIESMIHNVFKNIYVKKLEEKYSIKSFLYDASSDWECSYVWAYRPVDTTFAYYKTKDKKAIYKLNLQKEFFTIDVKYDYFEAPVLGTPQQINVYEPNFLNNLMMSMLNVIKQKCNKIKDNRIYFESYNEIVYLTNGKTCLQSILLPQVEEVFYKNDRLSFSLKDRDKIINFAADKMLIEEFESFITNYNLRKIATKFDYTVDKLINTTQGTKFIVDNTRNRVVYCAGLNSIAKFSFLTIMFSNLESAKVEKSPEGYFVRINTKDNDIIDVTCKKASVAHYIVAQITTIVNS